MQIERYLNSNSKKAATDTESYKHKSCYVMNKHGDEPSKQSHAKPYECNSQAFVISRVRLHVLQSRTTRKSTDHRASDKAHNGAR